MFYEVLFYQMGKDEPTIKKHRDFEVINAYAQKLLNNPYVMGVWLVKKNSKGEILKEYIY